MTEFVLHAVGVIIALGLLTLVVLAVTGRARVRSCCSIPAERDLRLRDPSAFTE